MNALDHIAAPVVDFRHEQAKRAGAAARAKAENAEIDRVHALVAASTVLLIHLTRGGIPNAPAAMAMEGEIVKAAAALARQDTFQEWADVCGVEL